MKTKTSNLAIPIASYLTFILFGTLTSLVSANLSILADYFNIEETKASFLLSSLAIGRICTLYLSGSISDLIGRKKVILFAVFCVGLFYLSLPLTSNFIIIMITIFIAGAGHGMVDSASTALLFDCFSNHSLPIALIQGFFSFGCLLTPLLTSILVKNNYNFKILYFIFFIFSLFIFIYFLFLKIPKKKDKQNEIEEINDFKIKPTFKIEGILIGLTVFLFFICLINFTTWVTVYNEKIINIERSKALTSMFFYNLSGIFGTIFISKIIKKIGETKVYILLTFICTINFLLYIFLGNKENILFLVCVVGFFAAVVVSLPISLTGEMFFKSKGKAVGILLSIATLGSFLTQFISNFAIKIFGLESIFFISFIFAFLCFVSTIVFAKRLKKIKFNY